jgi:DNA-binding CsgD family transcriptional regulator
MPIVEIDGKPLCPEFATVVLGNQNLVAGLSERHAPPLTAVDVAGVAFAHAFVRLYPTAAPYRRAEDAATIVLVLHGRVVRAAEWPADPLVASYLALNWWLGPRAADALARAQAMAAECTLIPDLWRQQVIRAQDHAYEKAAHKVAKRRRWAMRDIDAALALRELPLWRDKHGYGRIGVRKALEPARLPDPDGQMREVVGLKQDACDELEGVEHHREDPEAILGLRMTLAGLTARERQLLDLLAAGCLQEEAAARMRIRPGTVASMVDRIKKKLREP